jgi:nucleotide-binding universal stress UspA family protein
MCRIIFLYAEYHILRFIDVVPLRILSKINRLFNLFLMKSFQVKRILIPTDFSKTSLLAVEHAAFMARLFKADLYLLHSIDISETVYTIYNPAILDIEFKEAEKNAIKHLNDLSTRLKKEYRVKINTVCATGHTSSEIVRAVKTNSIDLVLMGTHGAKGFNEIFIGSNAHKTVTICPCPVITVQTHAKRLGFTNIVLPVDDSLHSRQKVNQVLVLAKKFASKIHVLGLIDKQGETDVKKFSIKIGSVEKAILKAGLPYEIKIVKADNLAVAALNYSKKVKADLITVMTGHESRLTGMFLGAFAKQIVNHSRIPVMSIRPLEGTYESVSLTAASPF